MNIKKDGRNTAEKLRLFFRKLHPRDTDLYSHFFFSNKKVLKISLKKKNICSPSTIMQLRYYDLIIKLDYKLQLNIRLELYYTRKESKREKRNLSGMRGR